MWTTCLLFVSVILTLQPQVSKGDMDIVVKQCREDWCYNLDHNDKRYDNRQYYKKVFKLFSGGIPQLIYEDIPNLLSKCQLSQTCKESFRRVDQALDNGEEWAFRLIDSSAKVPAAFIDGTVTSLGDYDECLAVKSSTSEVYGQYCITDIFLQGYKGKLPRTDGKVSMSHMQHFNDTAYYFGICYPTGCSESDIKSILGTVLQNYPLKVYGHHSCDSAETVSLLYRIKNMRLASIVSLLFLVSVGLLVAYGTLNHLFRPHLQGIWYLRSFSLIENIHKLFYVDPKARPETYVNLYGFTYFKMFIIICGVAAHVMACIELPIGFFMLSHHRELGNLMSTPSLMPIFGDAGITSTTSLAGFGAMLIAFPLARQGKIPYVKAVLDRALRFILPILAVMSLDMVYYLPFNGPLMTRTSTLIVDKCAKYWWRSALFISNLIDDPINICSGHTYSLAVDVQLFAIGLPGIMLLAKRPNLGILYCLSWMLFGLGIGYYYVETKVLTPTMMIARNPSIYELGQFLKYIHMATSGYLFSYFSAILAAYLVMTGFWNKEAKKVTILTHLKWLGIVGILANISQYAPVLTNTLDIISQPLIPLFVVGLRVIIALELGCLLTYLAILDLRDDMKKKKDDPPKEIVKEEPAPTSTMDGQYSVVKGIFRLSFAIYMCNYLFIRTDFYTARGIFYTSLYQYGKRLTATLIFLLPWSFGYHLFFVAPFFNLITELTKPKRSSKKEA